MVGEGVCYAYALKPVNPPYPSHENPARHTLQPVRSVAPLPPVVKEPPKHVSHTLQG